MSEKKMPSIDGEAVRQPAWTARMMARYQRQMVLPQVGIEGQRQLLGRRVLVVGAGALGSAAATYLAAAGVGTLGLVDGDRVELSNLHRQILHDEAHIGALKTHSAAERLRGLNPDIQVIEHAEYLSRANTLDIFSHYDAIVNGSDNFPTRYLVNDAAVLLQKPLVDAAILRFEGQLAVYRPGLGCYRCLFPSPPPPGTVPDCADAGILGAVAGVLGSMEAMETLKILLDLTHPDSGSLMLYDALGGSWQRLTFRRDPNCVICGDHPTVKDLVDYDNFCGIPELVTGYVEREEPSEFAVDIERAAHLTADPEVTLIDVRDADEFAAGHLPRARHCALENLDQITAEPMLGSVLVMCATGVRSGYATQYLRSRGIEAWSLEGGTATWRSAGKPWLSGS